MPQLLPFRTRPSPMHPEGPNLSLVRTTPYSLSAALPKPPLPQGLETPKPFQAAAPPPLPIARTAATIMMPSPESARLGQSPHLNPRPRHLPTNNYPTPPPIVRKPWMWAPMAVQHPLLPMPLQPPPSTLPPGSPPSKPETPAPPPAGPSQHPLAGACRQQLPLTLRAQPGND